MGLILSSDNQTDFTKFKIRTQMRPSSTKALHKGSRDSQEHIEYEQKQQQHVDDENTVKYSDPTPLHPSKKYDGYVDKAIHRMDTDGVLPTPSMSESGQHHSFGIERQNSQDEQYKYAVTKLSQLNTSNDMNSRRNLKTTTVPPSNTNNDTENDEDDDLKQFEMDIIEETDGMNVRG